MTNEDLTQPNGRNGVKHHRHHHKLKHRFRFERTLGKGTYGKVKLATELETGKQVAIKTVPKSKIKAPEDLRRIHQEIEIMSSMVHPHIIAIHEVFENKERIVLVMEFASRGELYDYADTNDIQTEEVQRIFRQIVSAVAFCHMNNVVHRDLKLENIFLDEQNNVKIGDFGLSSKYDDDDFLYTFCGSPLYASPEIVSGHPYHGPEVDCWSLGVILYALVYRAMPFKDVNFTTLKNNIMAGRYEPVPYSSEAEPLIKHMLTVNAKKRATIEDIMGYDWVCGTGALPSPSEMYLKVSETAKQPKKSILKNSSCTSGGSEIQSNASSVYSDPLSGFNSSLTPSQGSQRSVGGGKGKGDFSGVKSNSSNGRGQSLFKAILMKREERKKAAATIRKNDTLRAGNFPENGSQSVSEYSCVSTNSTSGCRTQVVNHNRVVNHDTVVNRDRVVNRIGVVNRDGVVLRTKKLEVETATEVRRSRGSVRLSKRMSRGKYSRLTEQWEQLCRGERQELQVSDDREIDGGKTHGEPEQIVLKNRDLDALVRTEGDNYSSGDDSVVLEILSTPVLKKTFSFDFEVKDGRAVETRVGHRHRLRAGGETGEHGCKDG